MKRSAVFLDRDGTIIEDPGYIANPEQVRLLPDSGEAIRRFRQAGHLVVVVSNQSGVARGFLDEDQLARVHSRLEELLKQHEASFDGAYYCPYLDGPDAVVEAFRRDSELRKPQPGMILQAADDLDIDLSHSWMIGDSPRDVEAGNRAGCRTILVGANGSEGVGQETPTHVADSLIEASQIVEREMTMDHPERAELDPDDNRVVGLLEKIHDLMDRARREQGQQDFSFLRLFGALLQMFALVTGLWGAAALFEDQNASATARLALACFLQLASLSMFAVSRFR